MRYEEVGEGKSHHMLPFSCININLIAVRLELYVCSTKVHDLLPLHIER